jgi:hypothetical protein
MLVVVEVEKDVLHLVLLEVAELVVEVMDQKLIVLLEQQELQILVEELVVEV